MFLGLLPTKIEAAAADSRSDKTHKFLKTLSLTWVMRDTRVSQILLLD